MKNPLHLVYRRPDRALQALSDAEYEAQLKSDPEKAQRAFERAWEIRNFEIELYWKRATYFWAFIASAFVGYFALVNAEAYGRSDPHQHAEVYFVISLGFIVSLAWFLTNRGSKQWQRNWEVHVDLLEDDFTGPLYKTVHPQTTYSVSKLNEIVSVAIAFVWLMLGVKYLVDQDLLNLSLRVNWYVFMATMATGLFTSAMLFGHGRGRFGDRPVRMYRRSVGYATQAGAPAGEASGTFDPTVGNPERLGLDSDLEDGGAV